MLIVQPGAIADSFFNSFSLKDKISGKEIIPLKFSGLEV